MNILDLDLQIQKLKYLRASTVSASCTKDDCTSPLLPSSLRQAIRTRSARLQSSRVFRTASSDVMYTTWHQVGKKCGGCQHPGAEFSYNESRLHLFGLVGAHNLFVFLRLPQTFLKFVFKN